MTAASIGVHHENVVTLSDRDEDLDQDLAIFIVSVDAPGALREVIAPGMDGYDFDWAPRTG